MRKLTTKRLFVAYVGCTLICFLWMVIIWGFWCTDDQSENEWHERYEHVREQLVEARRLRSDSDDRLEAMQSEVHSRYPADMHEILSIVNEHLPTIYVVTPTYARSTQKAELTRLSQTLLHVRCLHWIVVEDAPEKTKLVTQLLSRYNRPATHLSALTPPPMKLNSTDPNWYKPRGVWQRNKALTWIRGRASQSGEKSVVYFADDDNTYDLALFDEMRLTVGVSVWPVGLVGKLRYETPVVHGGHVVGWLTFWHPERPMATDMAGFAVNTKLFLQHPLVEFSEKSSRGFMESDLLVGLKLKLSDLEARAHNCTKILVWHTRTEVPSVKNEMKLVRMGLNHTDLTMEV